MTGMVMDESVSGVARLRARQRRRRLFVIGALVLIFGDLLLMWSSGNLPRDVAHIPPEMAIGGAIGVLVGAAISYRFACRSNDEHDVRARRLAAQAGFISFMIGYPVWALLTIGRVLPPVNEPALFAAVLAIYLATFLRRKYR
ncbi:MAG: hypothetical protein ACTHKR_14105 [Sphingomonas sp.]